MLGVLIVTANTALIQIHAHISLVHGSYMASMRTCLPTDVDIKSASALCEELCFALGQYTVHIVHIANFVYIIGVSINIP